MICIVYTKETLNNLKNGITYLYFLRRFFNLNNSEAFLGAANLLFIQASN